MTCFNIVTLPIPGHSKVACHWLANEDSAHSSNRYVWSISIMRPCLYLGVSEWRLSGFLTKILHKIRRDMFDLFQHWDPDYNLAFRSGVSLVSCLTFCSYFEMLRLICINNVFLPTTGPSRVVSFRFHKQNSAHTSNIYVCSVSTEILLRNKYCLFQNWDLAYSWELPCGLCLVSQ
jgi:hypothetical protein